MRNLRVIWLCAIVVVCLVSISQSQENPVQVEDMEAFLDPSNIVFDDQKMNLPGKRRHRQPPGAPVPIELEQLQRIEEEKREIQERIRQVELEVQEKARAEQAIEQELAALLLEEQQQAAELEKATQTGQTANDIDPISEQKMKLNEKAIELERLRAKEEEMRLAREQEEIRIRLEKAQIESEEARIRFEQQREREQKIEEIRLKNEQMNQRKAALEERQRKIKEHQESLIQKESDLIQQQKDQARLLEIQAQREEEERRKSEEERIEQERLLRIKQQQEIIREKQRIEQQRIQMEQEELQSREENRILQERLAKEKEEARQRESEKAQEEKRLQNQRMQEEIFKKQQEFQRQKEIEQARFAREQELLELSKKANHEGENIPTPEVELNQQAEGEDNQEQEEEQSNQQENPNDLVDDNTADNQELGEDEEDGEENNEDIEAGSNNNNIIGENNSNEQKGQANNQQVDSQSQVASDANISNLMDEYLRIVENVSDFIEITCVRVLHPGFEFIRTNPPFNYIFFTYVLIRLIKLISKRMKRAGNSQGKKSAGKFSLTSEAQMDFADLQNQLEALSSEVSALSKVIQSAAKNQSNALPNKGSDVAVVGQKNSEVISATAAFGKITKRIEDNEGSLHQLEGQFNSLRKFQAEFQKNILSSQKAILEEVFETKVFMKSQQQQQQQVMKKRNPSSGNLTETVTTSASAQARARSRSKPAAHRSSKQQQSGVVESEIQPQHHSSILKKEQDDSSKIENQLTESTSGNPNGRGRKSSVNIEDQFVSVDGGSFFDNPVPTSLQQKQAEVLSIKEQQQSNEPKRTSQLTIQRQKTTEENHVQVYENINSNGARQSLKQPLYEPEQLVLSNSGIQAPSVLGSTSTTPLLTPRQPVTGINASLSPFEGRPAQKSPFTSSKPSKGGMPAGGHFSLDNNDIASKDSPPKQAEGVMVILPSLPNQNQISNPLSIPRPVAARPGRRVPAGPALAQQFQAKQPPPS